MPLRLLFVLHFGVFVWLLGLRKFVGRPTKEQEVGHEGQHQEQDREHEEEVQHIEQGTSSPRFRGVEKKFLS